MNSSAPPNAPTLIQSRRGAQTQKLAITPVEDRDDRERIGELGHDDLQVRRSRCSAVDAARHQIALLRQPETEHRELLPLARQLDLAGEQLAGRSVGDFLTLVTTVTGIGTMPALLR